MKIVLTFNTTCAAKNFCEKAKKLSYVTYANDYMAGTGYKAMVCTNGEITEEQEQEILSLKGKKSRKVCKSTI